MPATSPAAVEAAKTRAKALSARLSALGVPVSHGQALEALAASEGFADWNRWSATLARATAPPPELTLGHYQPGDGGSVVWRMHALTTLERFPHRNLVQVTPFWYPQTDKAAHWRARTHVVEASLAQLESGARVFPSVKDARGKVVIVMPPKSERLDSEGMGRWLLAVEGAWKNWKGCAQTQAWYAMDLHRYPQAVVRQLFAAQQWAIDVHLFSQALDTAVLLDQPRLKVLALRRTLRAEKWLQLQNLRCQWLVISDVPMEASDERFESMEGWFALIGPPLTSGSFRVSGASPRLQRCLDMLEEERALFRLR